ncbi:B12-binding domain-containing radical SAM protein [Nanoarchaeota archaeon]
MKILLINPPYSDVYTRVSYAEGVVPPLGLAYLAAYAREKGFEVKILDANALQIPLNKIKNHIPKDIDVVGTTSFTPSLNKSCKILSICKEINPNIITIIGGAHISALPKETLKYYSSIDFGIIGEGEITLVELLKTIQKKESLSTVKGICYRDGKEIKLNQRRELIEDLDILPFPAYDLLPVEKYCVPLHHVGFGQRVPTKPFAAIFTSRGCPYNCTYCASKVIWERKVRFRNPKNVLAEIDHLVKNFNIKVIDIADDIFTINNKVFNAILDGLIERDYDLHFNCLSRVNTIDMEKLKKLKKAKCYLIRYGVESGSQKVLNLMKKNITKEEVIKAFKMTHKVGIPASASFIIGHPGETNATVKETIDLAKKIDPVLAHFFVAIPLVGTELHDIARIKGLIVNNMGWEQWVQMPDEPILRTEKLSVKRLKKLRDKAYKEFYFRPSFIIKSILRIRRLEQIKLYIRGFLAVLKLTDKIK